MSAGEEMVAIPPGQVRLSDRRTQRSWSVKLGAYQLAALPVTQARYLQVTGQRPSAARGERTDRHRRACWPTAVSGIATRSRRLAQFSRPEARRPSCSGSRVVVAQRLSSGKEQPSIPRAGLAEWAASWRGDWRERRAHDQAGDP